MYRLIAELYYLLSLSLSLYISIPHISFSLFRVFLHGILSLFYSSGARQNVIGTVIVYSY